mgnify:CR=1 FL=1
MAARNDATGWAGWAAFAGIMMFLVGSLQMVVGLVALIKDEIIGPGGLLVFDVTGWGWAHIVFGALLILAGASALSGNIFGRVFGILLASLSAVANMVFIPAEPVWSLLVITLDVLVIYALAVHGGELRESR